MSNRTFGCIAALILALPVSAWAADAEKIYAEKCARCHGDMAKFVARSVCLTDAMPVLKEGGEKLETFLTQHGRLRPDEIETVCKGIAETLKPLAK